MLNIIIVLHIFFVLFVVLTPFVGSNYLMLLHVILVPFMVFHWYLNNNMCALTIVEKNIRKSLYGEVESDDCFTCKLIEPVYDFKKNYESFSTLIYAITFVLWSVSAYKLTSRYMSGELRFLTDFCK